MKPVHQHFCLTVTPYGEWFALVKTLQGRIVLSVGLSIQIKWYSPSNSFAVFPGFPSFSMVYTSLKAVQLDIEERG